MTKQSVSIVKYQEDHDTIRNALELCDGFKGLKANDKVLIKPNIVLASNRKKIPIFGVVTTTRILEEIIILLREYGCTNITIGEGSPFHGNRDLIPPSFQGFFCSQFQGKLPATILIPSI